MVRDVNATQVAPCDKLTDNVYHYDAQEKIFELGEKFVERQQEREEHSADREEKVNDREDHTPNRDDHADGPAEHATEREEKAYLLGYDDEMPDDNELIRTVISLIKTIKDEKVLSLLAGQIKVAAELYS